MGGFREFTKVEILAAMEQHTKQVRLGDGGWDPSYISALLLSLLCVVALVLVIAVRRAPPAWGNAVFFSNEDDLLWVP